MEITAINGIKLKPRSGNEIGNLENLRNITLNHQASTQTRRKSQKDEKIKLKDCLGRIKYHGRQQQTVKFY